MATVEDLCENISLVNKSKVVLQGSVAEIRKSYARGSFRAMTKQPLVAGRFNIESQTNRGEGFETIIRKEPGESNNQVLSEIIQQSEVISFEELLPGMDDIFISVVGKSTEETEN